MTTNGEAPGGGAAFWAALGVRIEPEPEAEAAEAEAEQEATAPEADIPVQAAAIDDEAVDDEELESAEDARPEPVVIPAQEQVVRIPAQESAQQQASLDEVEPQQGDVVDGLAVLNESLAESRRAREDEVADERQNDTVTEPAWQLVGDVSGPLPPLKTCLEAILMVVDEPVTDVVLAQVVERPKGEVAEALRELAAEYTAQGRGFELREVGIGDGAHGGGSGATGWRIYSRPECAPVVERFVRDGQQAKLTQAALETLAVVAYRQPVSRSKVSAIRGVNCDGVMRTLLARGLVEECGTEHETGALLYQTTGYFLERMGLKGLDELPDLAPLLPSAAEVEEEA
jgi:segregation and condensation protein B